MQTKVGMSFLVQRRVHTSVRLHENLCSVDVCRSHPVHKILRFLVFFRWEVGNILFRYILLS